MAGLDPRERAFAHELAWGVTRLRARLDHLIAPHVRRGIETVHAEVLELLRLGAYQALYLGGVPSYAAVSETVDQTRERVGDRPTGFVNAVLRKVLAAGEEQAAFPDAASDPLGYLSRWGSHPEWLVRRWLARFPVDEVRALVEANNARPPTYLAPLDVDAETASRRLAEGGVAAEVVGRGTGCVRLESAGEVVRALEILPRAVVQDPAAHLVARYVDVPSGAKVADLCSAPGGKALVLAARASSLVAADRSPSRLRMVRDNAQRTGITLDLVVADALHPPLVPVDAVLLDAPCTGTGTLARHPDARWRLRPDGVREMADLQRAMLDAAAEIVAPGGLLVYSTCTLEPEENEERVADFLGRHHAFRIEATDAVPAEYLNREGSLVVTPQQTGFDGSFAARMRKVS